MQESLCKTVGEGITVFTNDMVRVPWKFLLDSVQHFVDLAIGIIRLPKKN